MIGPDSAYFALSSFPGPIYERRGHSTHCLRMRQVSMVTIYNNIYNNIQYPTFFRGSRCMGKQCILGPLLLYIETGNEAFFVPAHHTLFFINICGLQKHDSLFTYTIVLFHDFFILKMTTHPTSILRKWPMNM